MSEDPSNPPYRSYWLLTRQHPELTIDCECERRFYDACGCISGACPWCGDTGKRPKDLGELLTMLEEAGWTSLHFQQDLLGENGAARYWIYGEAGFMKDHEAIGRTREEAAAQLWIAVTGRTVPA